MTATPPFTERLLLDDGWFRLNDVRCIARPPALSGIEEPSGLMVVLPLGGVFVRYPAARRRPEILADPTLALFFRPGEPYRVSHPLGGADRSLDLTVPLRTLGALGIRVDRLPDAVPTDAATDVLVRRWRTALATDRIDPLAGAETAVAILDEIVPDDPAGPAGGAGRRSAPDGLVDRTRLAVSDRLGDRLTLPELGRLVGSSPFHLARRFRAATGSSIHRYRTALRVRAALERVAEGEHDLTSLALDLGFADHSHLTNVVRRETGRPPSAFRLPPTATELRALRTILQA